MVVLTPDAYLVEFGGAAVRATGYDGSGVACLIASMPLMNLTRQDRQLGQGGRQEWTFRYRIVMATGPWDPLAVLRQAQQFGTPPFLWAPRMEPAVREIAALDIRFDGGPLVAVKRGLDGERLILRFCNLLDTTVSGSLRLPEGYLRGESCDGLERPIAPLAAPNGRLAFEAAARSIATLALCR
ncbi:MAG: hypothetical protein JXR77_16315 [Lentisphaeria bacterium]|nr:hypothetical protein [Lentisphaeria bacterium]